MRRQAVLTFIPFKQRRAIRRAIFASSQSTQTLNVWSNDPDTMRPFDSAATHLTCARRGRQAIDAFVRLDAGAALR